MKKLMLLLAIITLLVACGGKHSKTEKLILDWGQGLNLHLTTSDNNEYPEDLNEVDPAFRSVLSTADGWGNELYYRKLRDDRYQLISAGPNGQLGDDDDIISANGLLSKPADIYAENPIE